MSQLIQLRRGLAATWTSVNPTLASGEIGVETDTLKVKVGNGTTVWTSLAYIVGSGGGGGISDAANDAFFYLRHALGWSVAAPFASLAKTAVKTANYTTPGNEIIPADTSSAGFNVQLPTAPADGTLVWPTNHKAGAGTGWSVNPLVLLRGGSDTIDQVAANAALTGGRGTLLQYVSANTDWRVLFSDAGPVGIGALLAANNGSDFASIPTTRTNLGLAIGTNVEAWDADLDAFAALDATAGMLAKTGANAYARRTIAGTSNRITMANGDGAAGAPTVDISSSYVGQTSITTLGTIATGVWNGSAVPVANGGTGATTAAAARTGLGIDVEEIDGHIETVANKTYVLRGKAKYAGTINSLYHKTASGTVTLAVQINGTNVTGLSSLSSSSTAAEPSASAANTFAVGDRIILVATSNSSALDLEFALKVTR